MKSAFMDLHQEKNIASQTFQNKVIQIQFNDSFRPRIIFAN